MKGGNERERRRRYLQAILQVRSFFPKDSWKKKPPTKEELEKLENDPLSKILTNLYGHGRTFEDMLTDWDRMTKPPIEYYLSPKAINDLYLLSTDVKLMGKPAERYKIMENILAPYHFKILASGTNRRCFYHTEDPTIVLKIGSDLVGRTDNISEYFNQTKIRPFCAKAYSYTPNGVCLLEERVEPLTQEDFTKYSKTIYEIVCNFTYRGYLCEDIGAAFFKNWGYRVGYYPVLIDFPYVREIDFSRLKCIKPDPVTGKLCGGYLDYDISLSQVECTKCGTRYSLDYLAKAYPAKREAKFSKKERFNMSEFRAVLMRGNKVVMANYGETNNPKIINSKKETTKPKDHTVYKDISRDTPKHHDFRGNCVTRRSGKVHANDYARNHEMYPEIKERVMDFLVDIERDFGKGASIDLARRLNIFYKSPFDKKKEEKKAEVKKNNPSQNSNSPKKAVNDSHKETTEAKYTTSADVEKENERRRFVMQNASRIVRGHVENRSNFGYSELDHKPNLVPVCFKNRAKKTTDESIHHVSHDENATIDTTVNNNHPVVDNDENPDVPVERKHFAEEDDGHQKKDLYPVKPMTAEEIEKQDMKDRKEDVVLGFPGEPLAVTMAVAAVRPKLKKEIEETLNMFKSDDDDEADVKYLTNAVYEQFGEKIYKAMNSDKDHTVVTILPSVDNRNNKCYAISIRVNSSPFLDATVYPKSDNPINESSFNIAKGVNPLDSFYSEETAPEVIEEKEKEDESDMEEKTLGESVEDSKEEDLQDNEFVSSEFDDPELEEFCNEAVEKMEVPKGLNEKEAKDFYSRKLIGDLMSYKKVPYAKANVFIVEFVEKNYPFDNKKEESVTKVEDEL